MDLHFRLAMEQGAFFDGQYPSHTVNYDNSISPYPMTSGEMFHFWDSRWYWDGRDIIRVNSRTWNFARFRRDDPQATSVAPGLVREEDTVSIPRGPQIVKERDESGRLRCIRSYDLDGSRRVVVFFDPAGRALYANLYKDNRLDRMQVFYPTCRIWIEELYDERGVRRLYTEWDEEAHVVSTKT